MSRTGTLTWAICVQAVASNVDVTPIQKRLDDTVAEIRQALIDQNMGKLDISCSDDEMKAAKVGTSPFCLFNDADVSCVVKAH